ncbi:hypothetical protein ACL9RF_04860 [Sphingobacterium sp. Mn56C]|uniref:hypothetical protein n=1 Tax=Sphingobacterium sp. Mn56C TaxID=3395261 RepID=UPI003BD45059
MDISQFIKKLTANGTLNELVKKHSLIVDDKLQTQGVLFFIYDGKRDVKLFIPAPFHLEVLAQAEGLTNKLVLQHKEAMLLQ